MALDTFAMEVNLKIGLSYLADVQMTSAKLLQGSHFVCRRKWPPVGGDFRRQPKRETCTTGTFWVTPFSLSVMTSFMDGL